MSVLVLLYQGGRWIERKAEKPETRGDYRQRYMYDNLIELDGVTYRQRKDVTSVLLMGIDTQAEGTVKQGYRNGGQADFLRLMVMDNASKSIAEIQIDRDTMTPITVLGVLGNESGVRTAQVCLAHGFGDGQEQSCALTVKAISDLLFGITIDSYVAMNMDGISMLNDMLGGVTVTLEDDFSALDPAMTDGATLTLMGEQAEIYVRSRRNIGIGTNAARMVRQEAYISQLMDQMYQRMSVDNEFASVLYESLSPYLTTSFSQGEMINEVWASRDYAQSSVVTPSGTHEVGTDGFMQFHADEDALKKMVIELFCEELK